jgi:hypothetical protein
LGKTRIVLTTPYFLGFRVITPEGRARDYHGGSQWANVPLIDIDGDGTPDIVTGAGILNIDGGKVAGFGPTHPIAHFSGYAPCIGDADGDGHPEIYHMFADTLDNLHGAGDQSTSQRADVMAYDRFGKPVLGWPQQVTKDDSMVSYAPVMGDVAGDGKKEIVARDLDSIHVWSCDGKPQTGAAGVIVSGLGAPSASPTLADLDGDGKAEIVIFDSQTSSIRAWHGDGTPVAGSDGTIAILPSDCGGVSVADLGGDGVMDLFAGSYWVKWDPKTRGSTVINMVPGPVEDDSGQPTICDLEGNGQAEAIFGLRDGRIVVYQTHLACKPQWLQWPTANGNPQHTGVWQSAPR